MTARIARRLLAQIRLEQVGLVPDLDDVAFLDVDPQAVEHRTDVLSFCVGLFAGDVAHMQDHVGLPHLLQGGAEGLDQFVRQVGDEAHGVR